MGGSPTINLLSYTLIGSSHKINIKPYTLIETWIVKDVIIFDENCNFLLHKIIKYDRHFIIIL